MLWPMSIKLCQTWDKVQLCKTAPIWNLGRSWRSSSGIWSCRLQCDFADNNGPSLWTCEPVWTSSALQGICNVAGQDRFLTNQSWCQNPDSRKFSCTHVVGQNAYISWFPPFFVLVLKQDWYSPGSVVYGQYVYVNYNAPQQIWSSPYEAYRHGGCIK